MELLLISFGALFSIINPLSTVLIYVGLMKEETKKERNRVALMVSINVLIILLLSFFIGKYILEFFGIQITSLRLAGGLIIASSGFALLNGKFQEHKGMKRPKVQKDIENRSEVSLTPLAIPMLVGPGTISLLIAYNKDYTNTMEILQLIAAMFLVTIAIFLILRSSFLIVKMLGASGINALTRIIGFIVISIGIQYITDSIKGILSSVNF